jgi:hypothetical protein
VTFSDDARTDKDLTEVTSTNLNDFFQVINGLRADQATSIGDGVFEGQALLANRFDTLPAGTKPPDGTALVVMSDGIQNTPTEPVLYAKGSEAGVVPEGDNEPPHSDWSSHPLDWRARRASGRLLPDITSIAIGTDYTATDLDLLARLSGRTVTHLDTGTTAYADLADAKRCSCVLQIISAQRIPLFPITRGFSQVNSNGATSI